MKCQTVGLKENDKYCGGSVEIHSALIRLCNYRTVKCIGLAVSLIHWGVVSVTLGSSSYVLKYFWTLYSFSFSKCKFVRTCGKIRTKHFPYLSQRLFSVIKVRLRYWPVAHLVQYLLSDSGLCWILQRKLKHLHNALYFAILDFFFPSASFPPRSLISPCAAIYFIIIRLFLNVNCYLLSQTL